MAKVDPGCLGLTRKPYEFATKASSKVRHKSPLLMTLGEKPLENIIRKGENAGNQYFLFPQCFLPFPKQISIFLVAFILWAASTLNLDRSRILSFGKLTSTCSIFYCYQICRIAQFYSPAI